MKDYAKLRELLESQETFPLPFTFKFVGRGSAAFARSVGELERAFPKLKLELTRESSGGKHVSKTYRLEAPDAEAILTVYRAIEKLEDLEVVL